MEVKDIVDLYWKRDENAIRLTQEKYEKYLMKIAVNILGDYQESEQSVNDTYLAAWNSMPDNRPDILSVYLGKITRRISQVMCLSRNNEKNEKVMIYEDGKILTKNLPEDLLRKVKLAGINDPFAGEKDFEKESFNADKRFGKSFIDYSRDLSSL